MRERPTISFWRLVEQSWLIIQLIIHFLDSTGDGCILQDRKNVLAFIQAGVPAVTTQRYLTLP